MKITSNLIKWNIYIQKLSCLNSLYLSLSSTFHFWLQVHRDFDLWHFGHIVFAIISEVFAYLSWPGTNRIPSRSRDSKTVQLPFPDSKSACQLGIAQWDRVLEKPRPHYPVPWTGSATHCPSPQTLQCRTSGTPRLCPM